ncbi:UNVERIFIED_CONTAM: hypothetical protein HDU68_000575 [Siphonaria sp. JEL0065]|nr:hypothetical protein HDU68_000575 [Siphonaria sp. JEL0065]
MGSRTELLAWANDLSQLGLTKIEQCGSGIVQCVIMDSIYRDVPLKKVKFNAKHEYEYIANFKVLQSVFDKHRIENNIPIEHFHYYLCIIVTSLSHDQGGDYDALARRAVSPTASTANLARVSGPTKGSANSIQTGMKKTLSTTSVTSPAPKNARTTISTTRSPVNNTTTTSMPSAGKRNQELEEQYQRNLDEMSQQTMELKLTVEQVEKEREFYFTKLREIELFVQEQVENLGVLETAEVLEQIQAIMYKTEEGFEIPDAVEDQEETF